MQAKQAKAYLIAVEMIAEAVREAKQIPSGHLYAMVMGVLTLSTYESIVATLKGAGLIEEKYHELFWVGKPVLSQAAINAVRWEEERGGNHCNDVQLSDERYCHDQWEESRGA